MIVLNGGEGAAAAALRLVGGAYCSYIDDRCC